MCIRDRLIDLIKPKPGDKILEIGCGWGGFAEHLAKNYDVNLDCITISKKQFEFTKNRINRLKLNNKVKVKFLDYRDLKDKYDAIASIEMIVAGVIAEPPCLHFKSSKSSCMSTSNISD